MFSFLQPYIDKFQNTSPQKRKPFHGLKHENFTQSEPLKKIMNSFEVFFICYDEPNKRKNWKNIKKNFPHARKVEGVEGFDKALKTCAERSRTEHFFVIDGDNSIVEDKLEQPLDLSDKDESWVLSWSAQNVVNGLSYGNGGLKFWPKKEALKIQTHENAKNEDDPTDYCFLANYYQINNFLTVTNINATAFQAFRAGYREGVKMSLVLGKQKSLNHENFESLLGNENRERLWVWCNIGADVKNGLWAIYGARCGLKANAIEKFDYKLISSYEWFKNFWLDKIIGKYRIDEKKAFNFSGASEELYQSIKQIGEEISKSLPIKMSFCNSYGSEQFKEKYRNPKREGLMLGKKMD